MLDACGDIGSESDQQHIADDLGRGRGIRLAEERKQASNHQKLSSVFDYADDM
jgi:hypothetical protein